MPIRERLITTARNLYQHMLATVTSPGELGTVANWSQHNLPALVTKPGEELAAWLGEPLPQSAQLPHTYEGPTRIIVPTTKTCTGLQSAFELKVIVLSTEEIASGI